VHPASVEERAATTLGSIAITRVQREVNWLMIIAQPTGS
jgi:hypothetical protein